MDVERIELSLSYLTRMVFWITVPPDVTVTQRVLSQPKVIPAYHRERETRPGRIQIVVPSIPFHPRSEIPDSEDERNGDTLDTSRLAGKTVAGGKEHVNQKRSYLLKGGQASSEGDARQAQSPPVKIRKLGATVPDELPSTPERHTAISARKRSEPQSLQSLSSMGQTTVRSQEQNGPSSVQVQIPVRRWSDFSNLNARRSQTTRSSTPQQPDLVHQRSSSVISSAVASTVPDLFHQMHPRQGRTRMESFERHDRVQNPLRQSLLRRQADEKAQIEAILAEGDMQPQRARHQPKQRRYTVRWTEEEEDRLVQLFLKYGPSWEFILAKDKRMGQVISDHRTGVDLKDKLRTVKIKMMR